MKMEEMMKVLDGFEKLFSKKAERKDDPNRDAVVKADMEVFKPLISDREVQAAEKAREAVEELRKVQAEEMCKFLHEFEDVAKDSTAHQRSHYMMWCEVCKDLYRSARCLDAELIARSLAEARYDENTTYERMERTYYAHSLWEFFKEL